MDVESRDINIRAMEATCKEFGLTKTEVHQILRIYSGYIYGEINSIDLSKDLKDQATRVLIPNVGAIYLLKEFRLINDLEYGHITKREYKWCERWFPYLVKMQKRVQQFKDRLK
jgi:hypothetical protein